MVWPFGSSDKNDSSTPKPTPSNPSPALERRYVSWKDSYDQAIHEPLEAAKEWAPVVLWSLVALGGVQLYANFLRRVPSAAHVRPSFFRNRSIYGKVTSVGDGDGFHMFHTPGGKATGWGWLRKVPENRKELKDRTISVRIAGVDAPECAHFGRPAQPYSAEAQAWLKDYILHRNVRTHVYRRDQYERIVGAAYVWRWMIRRNVGLEMVKRGLATVYEGKSDAEFGGMQHVYERAEAKAKRKKKGMWGIKKSEFQSPKDYKTHWAGKDKEATKS